MDDNKKEWTGVNDPRMTQQNASPSVIETQAWEVRRERDAKEKECEQLRIGLGAQVKITRSYWLEIEELKEKNRVLDLAHRNWRAETDRLQMRVEQFRSEARRNHESNVAMAQTIDKLQNENSRLAAKLRGIKMILKSANFRIDEK